MASDGGFGWLIMFCSMGCQTLVVSVSASYAMLLLEFRETFGTSVAKTGAPGAIYSLLSTLSGGYIPIRLERCESDMIKCDFKTQ